MTGADDKNQLVDLGGDDHRPHRYPFLSSCLLIPAGFALLALFTALLSWTGIYWCASDWGGCYYTPKWAWIFLGPAFFALLIPCTYLVLRRAHISYAWKSAVIASIAALVLSLAPVGPFGLIFVTILGFPLLVWLAYLGTSRWRLSIYGIQSRVKD